MEAHAIHISHDDGKVALIGPILDINTADSMREWLTAQSRKDWRESTAPLSVSIVAYDDAIPHLPLIPATTEAIINAIESLGEDAWFSYPDLHDRLVAQHGLDAIMEPWRAALQELSSRQME